MLILLFYDIMLPGIKAKKRSWNSPKNVLFRSRQCQALTCSPLCTMGSLQERWICSQERDMTPIKTPRQHLYPSRGERALDQKNPNTNSELVMHGMHCQLLKQTDHRSWHSLWPRNSSIWKEQGLWGRHACQATVLTCAPKGTPLKPRKYGEGDERGSKVWRSHPASKDLCTPGLLSLEKTWLERLWQRITKSGMAQRRLTGIGLAASSQCKNWEACRFSCGGGQTWGTPCPGMLSAVSICMSSRED